jgi:hypothetical protein
LFFATHGVKKPHPLMRLFLLAMGTGITLPLNRGSSFAYQDCITTLGVFMKLSATIAALSLTSLALFISPATYASCGSEITNCWDSCEGAWVPVAGNTCSSKFNAAKGCWSAEGTCGDNRSTCEGESTMCYDHCSGDMIRMENADSCSTEYSHAKGCMTAIGTCSKRP